MRREHLSFYDLCHADYQITKRIFARVNLCAALRQRFRSTTILCANVHQRIIGIYCLIQSDIELPIVLWPLSTPKCAPKTR